MEQKKVLNQSLTRLIQCRLQLIVNFTSNLWGKNVSSKSYTHFWSNNDVQIIGVITQQHNCSICKMMYIFCAVS